MEDDEFLPVYILSADNFYEVVACFEVAYLQLDGTCRAAVFGGLAWFAGGVVDGDLVDAGHGAACCQHRVL